MVGAQNFGYLPFLLILSKGNIQRFRRPIFWALTVFAFSIVKDIFFCLKGRYPTKVGAQNFRHLPFMDFPLQKTYFLVFKRQIYKKGRCPKFWAPTFFGFSIVKDMYIGV